MRAMALSKPTFVLRKTVEFGIIQLLCSERLLNLALSKPTFVLRKTVEFGFHSTCSDNVKISANGLLAERKASCSRGVVYGAKVVRGTTEFEVEIIFYDGTMWDGSLKLGVMQCKAGSEIALGDIPRYSPGTQNYCMFCSDRIENVLVGYSGPAEVKYGSTKLNDLRKGDYLGMQVSHDGVLTFFVNGKSQGVAAQDVYQEGYDLYPVVDVYASCKAVRITRAGVFTPNSCIY